MEKLNTSDFMQLPYDEQDGALCVFYPYKERKKGPAHTHYVYVFGHNLPDQRYAGEYDCEKCRGQFPIVYVAEGDSHNPHFCPACFGEMNAAHFAEFYIGDQEELYQRMIEVDP